MHKRMYYNLFIGCCTTARKKDSRTRRKWACYQDWSSF